MKNSTNKILSLITISLLVSSCSNKGNKKGELPDDIFWSISSAEKVVRDRDREYYSRLSKAAEIDIKMCQGEYESGQIVVTPNEDIDSYNARVSELKSDDGFTIPSKNINVYGASYCRVKNVYDTATGEEPGWFPDALLPISALVEYKDNKIKKGENQSFYVSIETPLMQKPGVYKGTITIELNNGIKQLPISVTVYDLQVSEESHQKSSFETGWQFECGELEASESMFMKYNEALLKYRLSPEHVMLYNTFTDRDISEYTEKSFKMMQNPKFTNVMIPTERISYPDSKIEFTFKESTFKKYINNFFVKSIHENFNMFKKAGVFMGNIIDEPDDLGIFNRAIFVCDRFNAVKNEVADELKNEYTSNPLQKEIIQSIRDLPNVVTASYDSRLDGHVEAYCPKANFYDTPEQRANYDFQKEKWWYTCVFPKAPYPTYHTEDSLSSARLLSWMQSNYDVVGNLYWSTNVFARIGANGEYQGIDDYYNGDAARYSGCNGDGYLFYPGKQYGIDGPVGTLRIEAIRDGLEEFEILYQLKQGLKALEIDDEAMFSFLINFLYDGTKVNASSIEMENARDDLIKLAMAFNNGSQFSIVKNDVDRSNNMAAFTFFANEGTTIRVNNENISPKAAYKNGHLFDVSVPLSGEENMVNIDVSYGGKTTTINHSLGGKNKTYLPSDIKNDFSKYNASIGTEVTTYADYDEVLRMNVGKTVDKKQSIKFTPKFINDINSKTFALTFNIVNPTEETILFSVGYRSTYQNYDSYFAENLKLKPGFNQVDCNLAITKWQNIGDLQYLMLVFGENTSKNEDAKTLYLTDVIVSPKQGVKA